MTEIIETPKLVTVFGGSGFIGRHVVRALAKRGYLIRVATRRPELAGARFELDQSIARTDPQRATAVFEQRSYRPRFRRLFCR